MRIAKNCICLGSSEYAYEHRDGGEDADSESEGSRGIGFRTWAQLGNNELGFQLFEFGILRMSIEAASGGRNRNGGLTRNSDSQIDHF